MQSRWIQIILAFVLVKPLFKLLYNLNVSGQENFLGLSGPLIIIGNHKYFLDSFALGAALPVPTPLYHITTFGESEQFNDRGIDFLRKIGFIKVLYFVLGIFPVIRGSDLKIALEKPISIIKNKGVVFLHPEGKIVKEDEIGPFKRGASFMALQTNTLILPVVFKIDKNKKFRRKYHIRFGPIFTLPQNLSVEKGADYMRNIIVDLYKSL